MVKCEIKECETGAKYGIKQEFAMRCKKHRKEDMIYGSRGYCSHEKQHSNCEGCKNDLVCGFDGCENKSTYGKKQGFPTRCKIKEHREERMVTQPRAYCQHSKRCNICKVCKGNGLCIHDRQRTRCKVCGGGTICKHGKRRSVCKVCGGGNLCIHGRQRNICKDCGGKSICFHDIRYDQCYICRPESNHFCIRRNNNSIRCIYRKNPKYDNYCATCFVDLFPNDPRSKTVNLPTKELQARQYLDAEFPNMFIYGKHVVIADRKKKCTSFNRLIDAQTEFDNCVLIIEIDENQHKYYNLKDEELRIAQIYQDTGKNLIIIRFNPDKYIENGKIKNPKMSIRYKVLKNRINDIIDKIENGYEFDSWYTKIKLFFDDDSKPKDDTAIRCAGFSKIAKRRCRNKVSKEGMFCHDHDKSQSKS